MTDITAADQPFLERAIELAVEADAAGDHPFGALLVGVDGAILAEDHNRAESVGPTHHPEFELARWAAANLDGEEARAAATLYTSTEHRPMCAAAHGWAGLRRIVYASSTAQLAMWLAEAVARPPRSDHRYRARRTGFRPMGRRGRTIADAAPAE